MIMVIKCRYGNKLTHPKRHLWYIKVSQITDTTECHIYQINLSNLKYLNIQLYRDMTLRFEPLSVKLWDPRVHIHI